MSTQKRRVVKPKVGSQVWPQEIRTLREKLGRLTQAEFAERLGTTLRQIQRWEQGREQPNGYEWITLGKLAGHPDCWFFWDRAGLSKSDIYRMLPEIQQALLDRAGASRFPKIKIVPMERPAKAKPLEEGTTDPMVALPLLNDAAAAGQPRLIEEANVESYLILPRAQIPHPEMTTCIRVIGDSMSPILEDGYIVVVDAAQTDRERLKNKIIAARVEEGVTIKWLREYQAGLFLMPENRNYSPEPLPTTPWVIIGRAILWLGHQE